MARICYKIAYNIIKCDLFGSWCVSHSIAVGEETSQKETPQVLFSFDIITIYPSI